MFTETPDIHFSKEQNRLYLRHGPIDLFVSIEADNESELRNAYQIAANSFGDILPELCEELNFLRAPLSEAKHQMRGPVAQRMTGAATRFSDRTFLTPMIAVAGAVADHIVDLIVKDADLKRVFVNNGGDISVYLAEGEYFTTGICNNIETGEISSTFKIGADDKIGGIATSGWKGKSHSLGIADAVTTFARSAAIADAAATLIANAVNLANKTEIERVQANELSPDSDLGQRLVTTNVPALSHLEKIQALNSGQTLARNMIAKGHIKTAYLSLQGVSLVVAPETGSDQSLISTAIPNHKIVRANSCLM